MAIPTPFRVERPSLWDWLWVRTRLRTPAQIAKAWEDARFDAVPAHRLARMGVAVPVAPERAEDELNRGWIARLAEDFWDNDVTAGLASPPLREQGQAWDEPSPILAWLHALPATAQGQAWRQRALWMAVECRRLELLHWALDAGADPLLPHPDDSGRTPSAHNLVQWLLCCSRHDPLIYLTALHARGVDLTEAMRPLPPPLRPAEFDAVTLAAFEPLGMDYTDPSVGSAFLRAHVSHPRLSSLGQATEQAQDACRWLLAHGADPNVRDAHGRTALAHFLSTQTAQPEARAEAQVMAWYAVLTEGGANASEIQTDGQTLLHVAVRQGQVASQWLPPALLEALVAANPGALTTPYPWSTRPREVETPLDLLRAMWIFVSGISSDRDQERQMRNELSQCVERMAAQEAAQPLIAAMDAAQPAPVCSARRPRM